ncbi:hypothetical protein MGYG_02268 [Nannizzia gypsea CBS 118893]|uniref:NADH-ubiquinone reductase complex 1 MLRQ subunit n=1 Tax=Arthroderma gypseum (strain ATCC MYA-4604 / CBS 118893) TaxID=535722 RepID=E4UQM6_ARTGP|nr:hypothetical protein MGYG_02268 [Nannizzia gypsea CBS 118893]EFQ99255.1 hypothetical protein MGYG_02268 [Nannizzia gypsea CBS 118893]
MFATRALGFRAARPLFEPIPTLEIYDSDRPMPGFDVASTSDKSPVEPAHTISQRLRTLKKIPPELIPLGVVLGVAIGAAIYSSSKKLFGDKTLRLTRSKREDH